MKHTSNNNIRHYYSTHFPYLLGPSLSTATSEDCNLYHKHYIWALGYQTSTKALNHRENLQDSPQQELISDMDEIWKGNISAEF